MLERIVPTPYLEKIETVAKSIFVLFLLIGLLYWIAAFVFGVQLFSF